MIKNSGLFSEIDDLVSYRVDNIMRVTNGISEPAQAMIAEELAVAISYDGTTHAVMMATPYDLPQFAVGFSLTENIITHINEIEDINIVRFDHGIDIQIRLNARPRAAFLKRRRHMAGPVGCGLCGIESLEAAMRSVPRFEKHITLTAQEVCACVALIKEHQTLNQLTRAVHGAGFYVAGQGIVALCEDIGRHNAVDKLIGTLLLKNIDMSGGAMVVTSRLSMEIIQKTAIAGIGIVIGISAPTAQALRIAQSAHLTIIARARGQNFDIHSNAQRVIAC